ncbi:tetratricopeptide repeat protein [Haloferula sp.]|uniref:tetratricopeptide repeat protein n=1 Tax=Haloferula sp. TaxID=2497595 RepID=UPI003C76769C
MRAINSQHPWRAMGPFLSVLLLAATSLSAIAEKIIPPRNLFRDPEFVRDFVGSYGFLSDIEPKVSPAESRMLVKIRELFEEGKFKQAEMDLVRFIKDTEAPTDPEQEPQEISAAMVFVLGNLYFSADRKEEARRAFLEAIRRFPNFRRAHVNLGYLYISDEQFDKAMAHFQQAVSLGEGNPRVFGLLGYTYLLKEKPLAAENAYRQAYLLDPDSRDWKLGLAQTLIQQEKMEEASALLGTLIEEYPEDRDLWLQQTNALLAQEKKMEAAVNLEVLRMKGLATETELTLLGNLYMDQEEPQLALYAYTAAMNKGESFNIERSLKAARILNDYGYPEKAEAFVVQIRAKAGSSLSDADLTSLELVEAKIAQSAGDLARVGELLEGLAERDPTNGEVLTELGNYYGTLAKTEENEDRRAELIVDAKTNLQIAAGIEQSAYAGNLALGQLLVRERQYIKAMPALDKAVELKPSDSLKNYVSRVRRAADREQQRLEREEAEREAKKQEDQSE